ncbi:hypothetical protein ILYODFUR_016624 [Ilyodon furcidens]|uniref:Uncharacterized protein n=1 Tax=Ilyodon furcidens TaxID=33524 RepID=A0ABV0TKQ6_9TELE
MSPDDMPYRGLSEVMALYSHTHYVMKHRVWVVQWKSNTTLFNALFSSSPIHYNKQLRVPLFAAIPSALLLLSFLSSFHLFLSGNYCSGLCEQVWFPIREITRKTTKFCSTAKMLGSSV